MIRLRARLAAVCSGLALTAIGSPAQALESLVLRMPFLETSITVNLGDAQSAGELLSLIHI